MISFVSKLFGGGAAPSKPANADGDQEDVAQLSASMTKTSISSSPPKEAVAERKVPSSPPSAMERINYGQAKRQGVVSSCFGVVNMLDGDNLKPLSNCLAAICQRPSQRKRYLCLFQGDKDDSAMMLAEPLAQGTFRRSEGTLSWAMRAGNGVKYFQINFGDKQLGTDFTEAVFHSILEDAMKMPFSEIPVEEQKYYMEATVAPQTPSTKTQGAAETRRFDIAPAQGRGKDSFIGERRVVSARVNPHVRIEDLSDDEESDDQSFSDIDVSAGEQSDEDAPRHVDKTPGKTPGGGGRRTGSYGVFLKGLNRSLLNSSLHNRTLVTRDDKIGLFKHNDDGAMEFVTQIRDLKWKGESVVPVQGAAARRGAQDGHD
jgi:hypothetical protein